MSNEKETNYFLKKFLERVNQENVFPSLATQIYKQNVKLRREALIE